MTLVRRASMLWFLIPALLTARGAGAQILSERFNSPPFPPSGWLLSNAGAGNLWEHDTTTPYEGSGAMVYKYNDTADANAWAFTAGVPMTAGYIYRVEFYQNCRRPVGEALRVTVGTAQTPGSQTAVLFDNTSLTNITYVNRVTSDFTCPATGTYFIAFNCVSPANKDRLYVDYIRVFETVNGPMTYSSSIVTQASTSHVMRGATNQVILGIQVVTSGLTSPLQVQQLLLKTNGTGDPAAITKARVFFTGTGPDFATSRQFGMTVASPTGPFIVTDTAMLSSGTNYFWLAYDISPFAVVSSLVDGECTSITISGNGAKTPLVTAPPGGRDIWDINYGGGPSAAGYYYANSTPGAAAAQSHPLFHWIVETTNEVHGWGGLYHNADEGYSGPWTLDFDFPFFGRTEREVYFCTNGFLTLGAPPPLLIFGGTIPSTAPPLNMIAPCMWDLRLDDPDSHLFFGGDVSRFIVTYVHARDASTPITYYITFQVILYPNGNILFQYNDTASTQPPPLNITQVCLVGIKDSTGAVGIEYRNNGVGGPMFGSPLALEFGPDPNALAVSDPRPLPGGTRPQAYELGQNYPNPFNPATTIPFSLPHTSRVTLKVYSLLGQEVCTLVDGVRGAGTHETRWAGTNDGGGRVASGVYLLRMISTPVEPAKGAIAQVRRLLLLR